MKREFVIDDDHQGHESLLRLLRENGYAILPGGDNTRVLLERSDARSRLPAAADGRLTPENSRETASGDRGLVDQQPLPSNEGMRRLLQVSPAATLVARAADGTVLDGNQSFVRLSGYDRDGMVGQNILTLFFFLDPDLWTEAFRSVEREGEVRDLETRMWTRDGLVIFVTVSLRREEIDGMACHVISIRRRMADASATPPDGQRPFITDNVLERLLAEGMDVDREEVGRLIDFQALQDLMNSFYKITRIGMAITDITGNIQVATGWQDVCIRFHRMHPETLKNCLESDIHLSRELGQGETIYKCKNGMWDMATPLIIGGRHIANIFLGQFFFEGEVPDYDFFRERAKTHGFDVEEYLAALDRVPRWSRKLVQDVMEFYRKLAVMISRLSIGTIQLSQALAQQKRISEELRQAKLVVESSPVVLFRWRAEQGWPVELVSDNVSRFGYSRDELLSGSAPFSALVHPDDLHRVAAEVEEYAAAGIDSFQQEYRIITRAGSVRWVDDRSVIERDAMGRVTHYQGTVLDITERKLAEEALKKSDERVRLYFQRQLVGMAITSPEKGWLQVNDRLCRMLGYGRDELAGMTWAEMTHPDDLAMDEACFQRLMKGELDDYSLEKRFIRKDGATVYTNLSVGCVRTGSGAVDYILALLEDISDRKRIEQQLRFTQFAIDKTIDQAFWMTDDGRLFYVNEAACRSLGYTRRELEGMSIPDIDPAFTPERFAELWCDLRESGSTTFETMHRDKDGRVFPVEIRTNYVVFDGREYNCAFATDISERRRSELALRESEEKFRVLAETLPAAIILHQGGKIIYANPATGTITGYDATELVGMNFWEWCREEDWDRIREQGQARLRGDVKPSQYEYCMVTKHGEEKWVIVSAGVTEYRGRPTIIATLLDITEAKRAEERIEAALAEKTVLLKEVHHRVKNNLQIISSLLDLQSDSIPDEQSRGYFRESQNRVRSMALVHERLYLSRNLDSIDFGDYVRDLAQYLMDSLGVAAQGVSLQVRGGEVTLGINEAIPCGLILNELVSNALKHAFPAHGPGEIDIDYQVENDWIRFRVADTGCGLPAGLDFRNTPSLGLQLVNMLVKQLRGRIEVDGGQGGTTVFIAFPASTRMG